MATSPKTSREVLGRMRAQIDHAEAALADLSTAADARRVVGGLKSLATYGRSTTFVLQGIRNIEPRFDGWYQPITAAMKSDPLMRYFVDLRNTVEKQGLPAGLRATVVLLKGGVVVNTAAVGFGEDLYGIWVSGVVDDRCAIEESQQSDAQLLRDVRVPEPPTSHLGEPLNEDRAAVLGRLYLDYLMHYVVEPAVSEFGSM